MSEAPLEQQPILPAAERRRIRFRIVHMLYAVALLGSSVAVFGGCGVVPGLLVLGTWAFVFCVFPRPGTVGTVCLVVLLGFCSVCLVLPLLPSSISAARRTTCRNHLTNLAMALQNYHDIHGTFPPAYIPDEDGKPQHSWRVLILPFLERKDLYEAYDFDETWDSPNNRKLLDEMPPVFACPAQTQPNGHTSYVAVVGPRTAWPGEKASRQADFTKGTGNTILIIEADARGVPWTKPRDLSLDEALALVTSGDLDRLGGHGYDDFFYEEHSGRLVASADGFVEFMHHGMSKERWAAALTLDDRKPLSIDQIQYPPYTVTLRKPKIGNWYRLGVFVVLTLLPMPWALAPLVRRLRK